MSAAMLMALPSTHAQDTVLSDRILPGETYLYFSMPSVQRFREAFGKSPAGQMFADPAFDDFKNELNNAFSAQLDEGFAQVQDAIGISVQELLDIPTGEVTLAVCGAGVRANKMGAVIFLDYGDHESDVRSLMDQAAAALSNVPDLESADTEYDGTNITLYNVTSEISRQTPLAKEFGWFMKDSRLVISNSRSVMELILDNWSGEADDTLRQNEVYSYILERCQTSEGSSLLTTYFDPIGLFKKVIQTGSAGEAGMAAGLALGMLPTLGLDQFRAMGSVAQMDVDGFDAVSRSFIYCDQPPRGAMQIFQFESVDTMPPTWVKDGASLYMSAKWRIEDAYAAIESLVDMFQGAGAFSSMIEQAAERGPQIHIKQDVVDLMDGTMQMVSAPGPSATGYGGDEILMAFGVRDESQAADLLVKLTSLPGFPGESREFQGATLYEIQNPGDGQTVGFTVANGKLLIGIGGFLLEQALRNDDDVRPLAESEDFQRVARHIPADALAVTYSHPANQYRSLYEMLRSGDVVDNFPGLDDILSQIDFGLLPSFDVIEKYLAPTGGYWVGDENGVLMETFSLKPTN